MTESLAPVAKLATSLGSSILPKARRLYAERSAGQSPIVRQQDILAKEFRATLSRLTGGTIDDAWWRRLLDRVGHSYVTPEFLCSGEVKVWLQESQVQTDIIDLARAYILNITPTEQLRPRLRHLYSSITGRPESLADDLIEATAAILLAGYFADMAPGDERVVGVVVADGRETRAGIEDIKNRLDRLGPDQLLVRSCSKQVSQELIRIQRRRVADPAEARERALSLLKRVQNGDLRPADHSLQAEALYWAARLHANQLETLDSAKHFREHLRKLTLDDPVEIIDALILDTSSDKAGALRKLRDVDNPDARATFFAILSKNSGTPTALEWFEDHEERHDPGFLTGLGWFNVCVALAETGRWEEAVTYLQRAKNQQEQWPDLVFLEGVINAALLLPSELRRYALQLDVFQPGVQTVEGPAADQRRERAITCFERTQGLMSENLEGRLEPTKQWILWLHLTHPSSEVRTAGREEVREGMKDAERALSFLTAAWAFNIDFDADNVWEYLITRSKLGGLERHEIASQLLLAELKMTPRELAAFLEKEEALLVTAVPKAKILGLRIKSLAEDGQTSSARRLLQRSRDEFDKDDIRRITASLDNCVGYDPGTELEALYKSTGSLIDLENLIRYFGNVRDFSSLCPLLKERFRRERTLQNALALTDCMFRDSSSGQDEILEFLETNQDLVVRELSLMSAKAGALFQLGRLNEARALNDFLLSERDDPADFQLDINLALQAGDWERFPGIVERGWMNRERFEPESLLLLSSLAAETDLTASRAFELVKLAAAKGSDNPQVLAHALGLAYRLGREGETRGWLSQALALSSGEGPVTQVELRTLVEELMPAHQERIRAIETHLLKGAIPLHFAAVEFNVPLSRLLIGIPRSNLREQDGRRRTIIPVFSGARQPREIQPGWTVGFDVTSIMILKQLGLLRQAIEAFERVMLAPDTMVLLLNERSQARFHQPSRVKAAEEILDFIQSEQLHIAESIPPPPKQLAEEVGKQLAQLLQAAKEQKGLVIRPRPVHKVHSLMNEEAVLGDYNSLILSAVELEKLLYDGGYLDTETHARAAPYLLARDHGGSSPPAVSLADGPFFLDDLALSYLQSAGLLPVLARSGLNFIIHPSVRREQTLLVAFDREGEQLGEAIEEMRTTLRDAIQERKIQFLRREARTEDREKGHQLAPTLVQFMYDFGPCDAICSDDRYINKNAAIVDLSGKSVPTVSLLDVLRFLEARGVLSLSERVGALHRLRQSGFALVPVEPIELSGYGSTALSVTETAEMRTIRQSLARIRSLALVQVPSEADYLDSLQKSSIAVIRQLWQNEETTIKQAVWLSSWIWRHVAPSPSDWLQTQLGQSARLPVTVASHYGLLLVPLRPMGQERQEAYQRWVQQSVIDELLPANAEIVDRLAEAAGQQIEEWSKEFADES